MTKRTYRNDMTPAQKQAISNALTGRRHSEDHKKKISQALEKYWAELPLKPSTPTDTKNNDTAHEKVYGKDND